MNWPFPPPPPEVTHNYADLPAGAPQPKIWKSLGHVMPGYEMHYGMETFNGEVDLDLEAELRFDLLNLGQGLAQQGFEIDNMVMCQQFGPRRVVRFVRCSCGTNLWTTRN